MNSPCRFASASAFGIVLVAGVPVLEFASGASAGLVLLSIILQLDVWKRFGAPVQTPLQEGVVFQARQRVPGRYLIPGRCGLVSGNFPSPVVCKTWSSSTGGSFSSLFVSLTASMAEEGGPTPAATPEVEEEPATGQVTETVSESEMEQGLEPQPALAVCSICIACTLPAASPVLAARGRDNWRSTAG